MSYNTGHELTHRPWATTQVMNWLTGHELTHRPWTDTQVMNWLTGHELTHRSWADSQVMSWLTGHELSVHELTHRSWATTQVMNWLTGHELTNRSWTDSQVMSWLTGHELTHRSWATTQVMNWQTGHELTHRPWTDKQAMNWLTGHELTHRPWTDTQVISWQLMSYMCHEVIIIFSVMKQWSSDSEYDNDVMTHISSLIDCLMTMLKLTCVTHSYHYTCFCTSVRLLHRLNRTFHVLFAHHILCLNWQLATEGFLLWGCPWERQCVCASVIINWKFVNTASYKPFVRISPNLPVCCCSVRQR